jgi:arsenate reductase (glutaredoxin)
MITLYHNPRCSKSRAALELLRTQGVEPDIILYLDAPPSAKSLKALLSKLNMSARALLRTGEEAYKTLALADPKLSEAALIKAMIENPKLIERPIAICGDRAVVGRPPETVLQLL